MNKKIFAGVSILGLLLGMPQPAIAETNNAVVVIDTGFDSSQVAANVIQEVCITSVVGCDNGGTYEIGSGASGTHYPVKSMYASDWSHGTTMAKYVVEQNSNAKLILIRNAKVYKTGSVVYGNESDLVLALEWVAKNKDAYNISGVVMSRGSHTYVMSNPQIRSLIYSIDIYNRQLEKMMRLTPKSPSIPAFQKKLTQAQESLEAMQILACPAKPQLDSLISKLQLNNVATIFATGNDGDTRYVDTPACLDASVAVASQQGNKLNNTSNVAPNTDFAMFGKTTSEAAARFAGKWSLLYNGNYETTYNSIKNSGVTLDKYSVISVN